MPGSQGPVLVAVDNVPHVKIDGNVAVTNGEPLPGVFTKDNAVVAREFSVGGPLDVVVLDRSGEWVRARVKGSGSANAIDGWFRPASVGDRLVLWS
jgi:hypothetical protein